MSIKAPNRLIDGYGTIERGMDAGKSPSLLSLNQAAFLVNATVRGGFPHNRPGWRKLELSIDTKPLTSITRVGTAATAFSPVDHGLVDGDVVTITGATGGDASLYNITAPVTIVPTVSHAITSIVGKKWERIARLNPDGSLDPAFNPGLGANGEVNAIAVQGDGKIIIGGAFTSINGTTVGHLARLNADGSVDTGFNSVGSGANGTVRAIAIDGSGKAVIAGSFTGYNGTTRNRLARLNTDGTLDAALDPAAGAAGGGNVVQCVAIQGDGQILIGGDFITYAGTSMVGIARVNQADGTIDGTFNSGATGVPGSVNSISIQTDQKIIIGGLFSLVNDYSRNNLARLNTDGSRDDVFVPPSQSITTITKSGTTATATTPFPHMLVIGNHIQVFGATGGDGLDYNIVATITAVTELTFEYTMPGTPVSDAAGTLYFFSSTSSFANGEIKDVQVQDDDSIMIGGAFTEFNSQARNRIARVLPTGLLDTLFDPGNGASDTVRCLAETPDHSVAIGGDFLTINDVSRNRVARVYPDGNVSFNPSTGASDKVFSVAVQSDGQILVGGDFLSITTLSPQAIVTSTAPHGLLRGDRITISGATGADAGIYNGTFGVVVVDANIFRIQLEATPSDNAVGTLSFSIPIFAFTYTMTGTPSGSATGTLEFSSRTGFEDSMFQGACYYKPPGLGTTGQIALMVAGRLFLVTPGQFESYAGRISSPAVDGGRNNPLLPQAWMIQAEMFLLVQDGQAAPIIHDGSTAKRSASLGTGIPVGKQMAYVFGRLWVANGREYVASDIVNGASGTNAYGGADAILYFTENSYLNGGGAFQVPLQAGDITAMQALSNLDTSLGQAELLVLAENGVFSVNVPTDRTVWQNLTNPLQRVAAFKYGSLGFNSAVPVNSDLFFRSHDGIRSIAFARRDFSQWGSVPISSEMTPILSQDDQRLLGYGSGVVFDNRLLMTCSPVTEKGHGVYHRGLIALDFHILSSMQGKMPPSYDGLWMGLNVLQLVKGDFFGLERCFAIVLSPENKIEIWEFSKDDFTDRTAPGVLVPIQWRIDGASIKFDAANQQLSFANGGLQAVHTSGGLKLLETADLFIEELKGQATFTLSFTPDHLGKFQPWYVWQKCANYLMEESELGLIPMLEKRPQYRSRMRIVEPGPDDEPIDSKPIRYGYEFQPRLEITGAASLYTLRLQASTQDEFPNGDSSLDTDSPCQTLFASEPPLFNYSSYGT